MAGALIITSHVEHIERIKINADDFDAIICADAGLKVAKKLGITPSYLIGDYDSMDVPEIPGTICLPMEKDMTDTEAALDLAFTKGFSEMTVLGGLGGRFDHTMGNIGMLARFAPLTRSIYLLDGQNRVTMMEPGERKIYKDGYTYLGLLSYSSMCRGVTVRGTKYTLDGYNLPNDTTLGVSNEITGEYASVKLREGQLLIIQTSDLASDLASDLESDMI